LIASGGFVMKRVLAYFTLIFLGMIFYQGLSFYADAVSVEPASQNTNTGIEDQESVAVTIYNSDI
jgi:hypothetical protein